MNVINPDGENVYSKLSSNFEETPDVKECLSNEQLDFFEQIQRGDLGIPSHALKAGAMQYEKRCGLVNKQFLLCKKEEGDPRKCMQENTRVADCAANFYKAVSDACTETFVRFAQCLEHNVERSYKFCRPEQRDFDHCVFTKLGMDKAGPREAENFGVYATRKKPVNPLKLENYDEPPALYPDFSRPLNMKRKDDEYD